MLPNYYHYPNKELEKTLSTLSLNNASQLIRMAVEIENGKDRKQNTWDEFENLSRTDWTVYCLMPD